MARRWVHVCMCGIIVMVVGAFGTNPDLVPLTARPLQPPQLLIASPVGGESWPIATAQLIKWSTKDIPPDAEINVRLFEESPTIELSIDDGQAELGHVEDGLIMVNRFTPTRYPATLERIRLLFPQIQDQPDPTGSRIPVFICTDPSGSGQPPSIAQCAEQEVQITRRGTFLTITVPTVPTLESGDFYIGYQAPMPANGVGFALDTTSPQQRTFLSRDGGTTFQPATFPDPNGVQVMANLLIRATVRVQGRSELLVDRLPNTGSVCWRVTGPTTMQAHIQIFDANDPAIFAESNRFTISSALQTITLEAPTQNEMWPIGQDRIIVWNNVDVTGNVKIELSRDEGRTFPELLFPDAPNIVNVMNMKRWRVTGDRPVQAVIKVTSLVDPFIFGLSQAFFIAPPGKSLSSWLEPSAVGSWRRNPGGSGCHCHPPPAFPAQVNPPEPLRVDVPNLGEIWRVGETRSIFWTSNGVSTNVRIELSTDAGATFRTILDNEPNDGMASWGPIPASARSSACLIRISRMDGSVSDTSDSVFVIDFPNQPSITLLTPNGEEDYRAGSQQRIRWRNDPSPQAVGASVKFELSLDGGKTFQLLMDRVSNNTDRIWTVPLVQETTVHARLRILSTDSRFIADVTNCDFTIRRP